MFRKPKNRNIRQRAREDVLDGHNSGEGDSSSLKQANCQNGGVLDEETAEPLITIRSVPTALHSPAVPSSTTQSKPKSILSFDQEEGDDVVSVRVKHKSSHTYESKAKTKSARKTNESGRTLVKKSPPSSDDIEILDNQKPSSSSRRLSGSGKMLDPEASINNDDGISDAKKISQANELSRAFPATLSSIPDAKAVYEARKKREMMRAGREPSFIPLDDTVRVKESSGERQRLVREDENDTSDEEDNRKFYSSKDLLSKEEEQRREEQKRFLSIEQGDSGSEADKNSDEDELLRWEREQIRKGVSSVKAFQLQEEMVAINNSRRNIVGVCVGKGEAEMDIDVDVEILEQPQLGDIKICFPLLDGVFSQEANFSVESVITKIEQRLIDKKELMNATEFELNRVKTNISDNAVSINRIASNNPKVQERFKLFQEVRLYMRDLLECLNEKIEEINNLDERIMAMWKRRTERLVKRRRQDVQDQYEKCSVTSKNRPWVAPSSEFITRESEREARRSRRRREREIHSILTHFEGLSSDDEETPSQEIDYQETISIL